MLKIFFAFILAFHGLVHLMGFVKAFELADVKNLKIPVSKTFGVIWLITAVIFIGAALQYLIDVEYWWLTISIGTVLSQILIITFWQDAKFGSLVNILTIVLLLWAIFL